MNCQVCTLNPATIKHHISYFPEVTTAVCEPCHQKIHSGKYLELTKKYVKYPMGDAQMFYRSNERMAQIFMGFRRR